MPQQKGAQLDSLRVSQEVRQGIRQQTRKNRYKGFSLLEMMIALGIGSVALYFISSLLLNMAKTQRNATLTSDFQSLVTELQAALNDPQACSVTFADPSQPYVIDVQKPTPDNLPLGPGQGIYMARRGNTPSGLERARAILKLQAPDKNQSIASYGSGLQITQVQIQDWSGVAPFFTANLYVQAQKYPAGASPNASGGRLLEKKILFYIVTDATGKISTCGNLNSQSPQAPASDPTSPHSGTQSNPADSSSGSAPSPSNSQGDPQIPALSPDLLNRELTPEEAKQLQDAIRSQIEKQLNH